MYSTCLFCNQALGANKAVEAFPVGRRLAFDQRLGRLWVVCGKCAKWNLTPLEERWEAIESCERLFRDSRKRVSTDQIGLAKLAEGLELIRIGEPKRTEFAAWRYGEQFGKRRRRDLMLATGVTVSGLGIVAIQIGGLAAGGAAATLGIATVQLFQAAGSLSHIYHRRKVIAKKQVDGVQWLIRRKFVTELRLLPAAVGDGWAIEVPAESGRTKQRVVVEGDDARRMAAKLVPALSPSGGNRHEVKKAVQRIEEFADPETYLRWLARNPRIWRDFLNRKDIVTGKRNVRGTPFSTLFVQGTIPMLAVEMAVNEENERRALEGELALLQDAWKDAEEIAAISDKLALPENVEARLRP